MPHNLKCLIIEDEPLAIKKISEYIHMFPSFSITGTIRDIEDLNSNLNYRMFSKVSLMALMLFSLSIVKGQQNYTWFSPLDDKRVEGRLISL